MPTPPRNFDKELETLQAEREETEAELNDVLKRLDDGGYYALVRQVDALERALRTITDRIWQVRGDKYAYQKEDWERAGQ